MNNERPIENNEGDVSHETAVSIFEEAEDQLQPEDMIVKNLRISTGIYKGRR